MNLKPFRFALDWIFVFMIFVSAMIFGIFYLLGVPSEVMQLLHFIDLAILGGYYSFFIYEVSFAKNKISYCKKHWVLIILLLLPLFPIGRFIGFVAAEQITSISQNTIWHILDELELL